MFNMITILGPTATGKTKLAANLATVTGGEIISADSRQVYRGMDIGTGKDIKDYIVDGSEIPNHLVNIVDPGYEYNMFEFKNDFTKAFFEITKSQKMPILCGGTGLYLDAILRNYNVPFVPKDPVLRKNLESLALEELTELLKQYRDTHNTTDTTDRERTIRAIEIGEFQTNNPGLDEKLPEINSINFGIQFERADIRERITHRLQERLEQGLVDEVAGLLENNLQAEQLTFYGLEYRFVTQYITGELTYDEMFKKLNTAIHQFAKRQMTWFRRMEKKGVKIHWIDGSLPINENVSFINSRLKN